MTIAICSADPYTNQIDEDIWLRNALMSKGHYAEIVPWDSDIVWQSYDCAILRSAWGYQHKVNEFLTWLEMLDNLNIPLLNPTDMVRKNIYKNLQIKEFNEKGIPFVPSIVISSNSNICGESFGIIHAENTFFNTIKTHFNTGELFVMKPVISASGNNTLLVDMAGISRYRDVISLTEAELKYKDFLDRFNDVGIIIQPYIPEIKNGEYAMVYINGNYSHCALRFPAIFDGSKDAKAMPNPPAEILELAKTVMDSLAQIPVYARVDIINTPSGPMLMEIELAEPSLLYRCVSHITPEEAIEVFADAIISNT